MAAVNVSENEKKFYHSHGKPEEIAKFMENKQIKVNKNVLKSMLMHKDVKNRKVVAFSIVGAFRKGKSYFLNFCLRLLYATYPSINHPNNDAANSSEWIGEEEESLRGFSFRPGKTRDTTGIVFWNDVFLHTSKRGEKIAIIVMDTQGLFDNDTTPVDNSRIFALSTLISSIQVLNLTGLIQEDQLQYLQFATEFAKYATNKMTGKAFQKLLFLIRDWVNFEDHDSGLEDGMKYLEAVLEIKPNQDENLKSVRQYIKRSFEELKCCLLPSPGKLIVGTKNMKKPYDGNWGDMDEDFKDELVVLIENLLKPDCLVVKKVNGKELTGQEFHQHILKFLELFASDELPQAQTIYDSTVENILKMLTDKCVERYRNIVYRNQDKLTNTEQLAVLHELGKKDALLMYAEDPKMGDKTVQKKFENLLILQVEKIFSEEWGNQKERNIKLIEEEQEKARQAEEELHRRQIEAEEIRKRTAEELIEMTKREHQQSIEYEQQLRERKLAEEQLLQKLKIEEQERLAQLEEMNINNQISDEILQRESKILLERQKAEEDQIRQENEEIQEKLRILREIENQKYLKKQEELKLMIEFEKIEEDKAKAEIERIKIIADQLEIEELNKMLKESYREEMKKFVWKSDLSIYDNSISSEIISPGCDANGNKIYCGRALHNGVYYPAKIVTNGTQKRCTITCDGIEIEKIQFEGAAGAHTWVKYHNNIPNKSVFTGQTSNGDLMYIGRGYYEGNSIPGKIIAGNNFMTYGIGGREVKKYGCEILQYEFE